MGAVLDPLFLGGFLAGVVEASDDLYIFYLRSLDDARISYHRLALCGRLLRKQGFTVRAEIV